MPMSNLESFDIPLEPTKEELEKITELQLLLEEYLLTPKINESVRHALTAYHGDEQLLLKYIRGRKLNVQKALNSLISYAEVKHVKYPEAYPADVPAYVHYAFQCGVVTVLKKVDNFRRTIVYFTTSKWDDSKITLDEFICVGKYLIEALMCNPDFLKHGLVLLVDLRGIALSHLRQCTLPAIMKFKTIFWQSYPIPVKGVFFANAPFVSIPFFALCKPFIPSKLKDRVMLTSGVSDIHKRISIDYLPSSIGGNLPNEEMQSQAILNYFTQLSQ